MLPTPSTSHIPFSSKHITIYEPAEDSFLLLDTLSSASEIEWLQTHFAEANSNSNSNSSTSRSVRSRTAIFAVEIGTGSGVIIAFLTANAATIFGAATSVVSLGVDLNLDACLPAQKTVNDAVSSTAATTHDPVGIYMSSICGDLSAALRPGSVDVMIFNPPYVPTEDVPSVRRNFSGHLSDEDDYERSSRLLALSYAGGKDGMEVTDRFLAEVPRTLSKHGVVYLLLCRQNKPQEVKERIPEWDCDCCDGGQWKAETVNTSGKQAGWEKLQIVRIWRECDESHLKAEGEYG